MNISIIRPATIAELKRVEDGIADFSRWFNSVPYVRQHEFDGRPGDISKLDWVFYELGGVLWSRDNGFAFTCVWGNVLVRSFGFQWSVMDSPRDLRDYLLYYPDVYQLFPWQHLWEAVESCGRRSEKPERIWLQIVADIELTGFLPKGWHPAIDAIQGCRSDFPVKAIQLLRELYERSPTFFQDLSFWPYAWNADTDWNQIQTWLEHLRWQLSQREQ